MNPVHLAQAIKAEAHRLGFELAGITTPDTPPHQEVYARWLAAGRQGEMGYLATERARQRRAQPSLILPECHSILVLGIRYPAPPGISAQGGRVAAYAQGADYHEVLPERLQALTAFLEEKTGEVIPNRFYTDTGPILERDLAQRAGLGWIGKNTCLIHPDKGSYFLLAEILLGNELSPDTPFTADRCGSCIRCIEACPTSCILPDRTLDAKRCISYLTIELKGAIPLELRPQIGEWLFGCDVCQQVCPWNRFALPTGDPAFAPLPCLNDVDWPGELNLTPVAFNEKFKNSPIRRAKRRGYLRNVAVFLGNSGNLHAIPALGNALLNDPEPLVRGHAAWALGRLGGASAQKALGNALEKEIDPWVQEEIRTALE